MKAQKSPFFSFFFILLLFVIAMNWDMLRVNIIVYLTLRRGIISQNCFWWSINDFFKDSTGAEVYQSFKRRGRFVELNILGKEIILLTEIQDIAQLLELSPNPFGPGIVKQNFFASFIPNNVGIAVNPDWKSKREYNDKVLETDHYHHLNPIFHTYIQEAFQTSNPSSFSEFTELTRRLTSKILFGTFEYNPILYTVFKQADSFLSARFGLNTVNAGDLEEYRQYLREELENPKPDTLMYLANKHHRMLSIPNIVDQIPHWVFPIAGIFSVHLPRLLVLLLNHPQEFEKVKTELQHSLPRSKESYTRKCILELFRLNNAVNSTFRGLTEPFQFQNSEQVFESGTQFVFFNNPVLRDVFDSPNQYIPSRWSTDLEESTRALMFNQGNQKCPGKELVVSLLTMALQTYLDINKYEIQTPIKIDPNFVPYILNPCTITFTKG
jgi:cytochrome P450